MEIGKSEEFTYVGYENGNHIFYNADKDVKLEVEDDQLYGVSLLKEKVMCTVQRARFNCYIVGVGGL